MAIVTTNDQHYSDIADSIRAKGVNGVFKPDEMADAIARIPSGGGGLPDGLTAAASGSFNVTSLTRYYKITHGLGVIPKMFVVTAETPSGTWYYTLNQYMIYSVGIQPDYAKFETPAGQISCTTNITQHNLTSGVTITVDENDISFLTYSPRGGFQPSQIIDADGTTEIITYRWYAAG